MTTPLATRCLALRSERLSRANPSAKVSYDGVATNASQIAVDVISAPAPVALMRDGFRRYVVG